MPPSNTALDTSAIATWDRPICSEAGTARNPARTERPRCLRQPPWTEIEQLTFEKEALGLYWSGHPIDSYATDLKEFGAKTIADLLGHAVESDDESSGTAVAVRSSAQRGGEETSAGGVVTAVRPLKTRKGDRMAVFFLEDRHGSIEVLAFKDTYARAAALIENGTLVVVRGKLERDDEEARLLASDILPIAAVREKLARELAITLAMPPHTSRDARGTRGALCEESRGQTSDAAPRAEDRSDADARPGAGVVPHPGQGVPGLPGRSEEDLRRPRGRATMRGHA